MKLGNFLAIDPNDHRKGLPSYGKLDEVLFHEFADKRKELEQISQMIRQSVANSLIFTQLEIENAANDPEEIYAKEGKIIYRLHKLRERNPTLIKRKKQQALQKTGKLACEVCGFVFRDTYGALGEGFIECHHVKPISQMKVEDVTRLEDLSLVCSNCHRMLHKSSSISISDLSITISITT